MKTQSYTTDLLGPANRRLGVVNNQQHEGWRPGRAGSVTVRNLSSNGPYFARDARSLDTKPGPTTHFLLYIWLAYRDEPTAPLACPKHALPLSQCEMRSGNRICFQLCCSAHCFPGRHGRELVVTVAEYCEGHYIWNCTHGHFEQAEPSPDRHRPRGHGDERVEALEKRVYLLEQELHEMRLYLLRQECNDEPEEGAVPGENMPEEDLDQLFKERYRYLDTLATQ